MLSSINMVKACLVSSLLNLEKAFWTWVCGTGHLTHMISEKGAHVIGIDSAEEMIAKAKAAFPEVVCL